MMMDPIANMLTAIRNGQAVGKDSAVVPFSKIKFSLASILEKEGWVGKVETQGKKVKKVIEIGLKYGDDKQPRISNIKRVSKVGQRVYIAKNRIRPVRQGYGMAVISTSRGLMSDREAKKNGLGGEVICEVY